MFGKTYKLTTMTDLIGWIMAVELDAPKEAQDLFNAIDNLQGNNKFTVVQATEEGKIIHVVKKIGYPKKLEVKSDSARTKMMEEITKHYLPLRSLRKK